jgi:hypothetical protein
MSQSKRQKIIPLAETISYIEGLQCLERILDEAGLNHDYSDLEFTAPWEIVAHLMPVMGRWLETGKCQVNVVQILMEYLPKIEYPICPDPLDLEYFGQSIISEIKGLTLEIPFDNALRLKILRCLVANDKSWLKDSGISLRKLYFLSHEKATFFQCYLPSWISIYPYAKKPRNIIEFLQPGDNMAFLYWSLLRETDVVLALRKYWQFVMKRTDEFDQPIAEIHLYGMQRPKMCLLEHIWSSNQDYLQRVHGASHTFSTRARSIEDRWKHQWFSWYFMRGLDCDVRVFETLYIHFRIKGKGDNRRFQVEPPFKTTMVGLNETEKTEFIRQLDWYRTH